MLKKCHWEQSGAKNFLLGMPIIYHLCAAHTKNTLKHVNDLRETLTTHHQKTVYCGVYIQYGGEEEERTSENRKILKISKNIEDFASTFSQKKKCIFENLKISKTKNENLKILKKKSWKCVKKWKSWRKKFKIVLRFCFLKNVRNKIGRKKIATKKYLKINFCFCFPWQKYFLSKFQGHFILSIISTLELVFVIFAESSLPGLLYKHDHVKFCKISKKSSKMQIFGVKKCSKKKTCF